MRAARVAPVRLARLPWLAALVALGVGWAAPAAHGDQHDEPSAFPVAAGAAAREPSSASETAPSGAASFAKTSPALAKLLGLGEGIAIGGSNEDQFLDPEVAFVLSAAAARPDAIEARWDIAEGYYLYRDKFRFRAADGSGPSLGEAGFPEGMIKDDEYFGPMEVYYGSVAALVPVAGAAPGGAVDVDITYQGCADAGLCYPPITKTVSLLLPAAFADTGAGTGPGAGAAGLSDPGSAGTPSAASNLQARTVAGGGASGAAGLSDPGSAGAPSAASNLQTRTVAGGGASGSSGISDPGSAGAASAASNLQARAVTDGGVSGTSGAPVPGTEGAVPAIPGLPAPATADIAPIGMPEQDRVAAALMSGNRWLVVLSLFGAGLLLTFTPCVLPMVPILTSIIVGRGEALGDGAASTRRAFALSLVYVVAMALTYTVAGVLAGLFGANLAAAFQDPWIVSAFALVFVLLALSMFGFYELQMPASWQAGLAALSHRQRGGTWAGVAAMGSLSALIVGPCVAAPLAGVLIYIGQTGDPVLGGVALFALGMGMGVPLIVAGVSAGRLLPKAGAWMNAVKAVFGVMLLAVAIYLLERVVPESVALLLWAALFIVCAIYMGALDSLTPASGGWRRLWKGTGLVMPGVRRPGHGGGGRRRGRSLPAAEGRRAGVGGGRGTGARVQAGEGHRRTERRARARRGARPGRHVRLLRRLVRELQGDGAVHVQRSRGAGGARERAPAPDRRHPQRHARPRAPRRVRPVRSARHPVLRPRRARATRAAGGGVHGRGRLPPRRRAGDRTGGGRQRGTADHRPQVVIRPRDAKSGTEGPPSRVRNP